MRAGKRVVVASRRPRAGAGALASLALHGSVMAAALVGLAGGGAPAGTGEPVAVPIMFVAGPPAEAPGAVPAEATPLPDAPAPLATPAAAPVTIERAAAHPEPMPMTETAAEHGPAEPEAVPPSEPLAPAAPAGPVPVAAESPPEQIAAPPPPPLPPRPAETRPTPPRTAMAARPAPARAASASAEGGPPGGSEAVGRPDAAGTPGPPAEPGPILASNPGFRRPPSPPAYPRQAIARGIEGTVLLRVLIGPDGETIEIRIHRSSGAVLLDQAAVEAVRRWAFRPALVGGRAVPAWVEVPVRFRLD
jgi:protein TonB